jgi:serine/threonine protein phosphatase PrpC
MMTSQNAVNFIHKTIYDNSFFTEAHKKTIADLRTGLEALLDRCCSKEMSTSQGIGCDNITAILVELIP